MVDTSWERSHGSGFSINVGFLVIGCPVSWLIVVLVEGMAQGGCAGGGVKKLNWRELVRASLSQFLASSSQFEPVYQFLTLHHYHSGNKK